MHYADKRSYEGAPTINVTYSEYPKIPDRAVDGANVTVVFGGFYMILNPLMVFATILSMMVSEKVKKLRTGLHLFGVSSSAHWLSWWMYSTIISAISSVWVIIVMKSLGFEAFINAPNYWLFTVFWSTCMAMVSFGFMVTTLVNNQTTGYTVSYAFIMTSVIFKIIFIHTMALYVTFFLDDQPLWVNIWKHLMYMFPAFNFSKVYGETVRISGSHPVSEEVRWVDGREFVWNDIFTPSNIKSLMRLDIHAPSPGFSVMMLWMNIWIYWILTWYFDHIMPNNRGRPASLVFFVEPCLKRR